MHVTPIVPARGKIAIALSVYKGTTEFKAVFRAQLEPLGQANTGAQGNGTKGPTFDSEQSLQIS